MKTIQEFIEKTNNQNDKYLQRPRIYCNDGFNISVQGSSFHYCSPRDIQDYYNSMELGFQSKTEPLIMEYAEEKRKPKQTVYGWVPVEVINQVITKHGGINTTKTFGHETV